MKKSTLFIMAAVLILWLCLAVIKPLDGRVFIDSNEKPKDFISGIINNFDKSKTYKYASLKGINHIKLLGYPNKNAFIEFVQSDSNKVYLMENNRYVPYDFENSADTLVIKLNESDFKAIYIYTNSSLKTLILDKLNASLRSVPREGNLSSFENLIVQNQSQIIGSNESRDNLHKINPIKITVKDKSHLEFHGSTFCSIDLKLNNGMLILNEGSFIDTLNANLQGLSNIIIGKYPDDKRVKFLEISGNLDYYNKRKPQ
ncbi:hypothetical protein [Sphingobacterium endophyticum]|uniref:hypothetical protein n=1 Tax=Sphingobacterium endophyticum TaxID=2546448 RepID=UPI0012E1943F|nr:hypothetical protein [Sphingobacterium endophyticum]